MFKQLILCALVIPNLCYGIEKGMIYGETGRLDQFDPYTIHESSGYRLSDLIFNSLVEIEPGYDYGPGLAQRWQINSSRTRVSFFLSPGVYWHRDEGETEKPLTAEDVVHTIEVLTHPESEITNRDRFQSISHAKAISSNQVDIYLKYAVADPMRHMMFKILPKHAFKGGPVLNRKHPFTQKPIGTGPYRFVKNSGQGEILLHKNSEYFKNEPGIQEIIMRNFTDQSIMSKSLMFSSLDLITFVSPRNLSEIEGDMRLGVVSYDALSYSFIGFNTAKPYLSDKRFRQGLAYGVNRQEMLDAFFDGKGELISGPFPPTSWAYNIDVQSMDYDLKRARQLIQASGYDGKRPLIFAVPLSGDSEMIKRIVLAYQSYLNQIGVAVELQFMDWLVWKKKVLKERNFDLTIASWSFDDASNIKSLFHSSNIRPWGHNFVQFKNTQVDSLLNEAEVTNDQDKRRAINHKLHSILADEVPYTFLWTLKHHAAYQRKIHKVRVEPYSFFKYITSWHIELELDKDEIPN